MKMEFSKMHGCGNDYVYVNCMEKEVPNPGAVSEYVSHRRFGIGSDGLILIMPSDKADFRMRMFLPIRQISGCVCLMPMLPKAKCVATASAAWQNMFMIKD